MTTAKRKRKATKKSTKRKAVKLPRSWPASEIVPREVGGLSPYARNAKRHSHAQVRAIRRSIEANGWTMPVLLDTKGEIIAGHGRVLAAELEGELDGKPIERIPAVPTMVARGWSDAQKRAYRLADNKLTESPWDNDALAFELGELQELDFDLELTGFGEEEVQALLFPDADSALAGADDTELPKLERVVVAQAGDLWILGDHRLLCGDSTRADDVARLMRDDAPGEFSAEASCLIADPPYGMGKEKEGIANDNQYGEKLDAFQMSWWKVWRAHMVENASAYLWGNAPDLWRLWYTGGLALDDELHVRNELVWNKGNAFGMKSDGQHSYSVATERCLFLMRGQQFLGNQNKDDYWEGWEPLRAWLVEQRKAVGWNVKRINEITGTHMAGHWFGKSQFQPISREHYAVLRSAADGVAFVEDYDELFDRLFPGLREGGNEHRRELSAQVRDSRTYFDNVHDGMHDVWEFPRVHGEDRFGHATPKPVAMLGRCVKSSSPEASLGGGPLLRHGDRAGCVPPARPDVLCHGARAGLRRRGDPALAGARRRARGPGRRRPDVRGDRERGQVMGFFASLLAFAALLALGELLRPRPARSGRASDVHESPGEELLRPQADHRGPWCDFRPPAGAIQTAPQARHWVDRPALPSEGACAYCGAHGADSRERCSNCGAAR